MPARPSQELYFRERGAELGFPEGPKAAQRYDLNLRAAQQAISSGGVIGAIAAQLNNIRSRYLEGRPDLLFYPPGPIEDLPLLIKPFTSSLSKLYRLNVLYNKHFPRAPADGWITCDSLFEQLDDLLRCRLVCKYMDGPQFVCEQLSAYCRASNIEHVYRDLSTDAGYYAWHFYFRTPVDLLLSDGDVHAKPVWVEIQFTTQLAEVITSLTHGLYTARRTGQGESDRKWKWDAGSQRFRSAYIGHGLHLLEGLIQTFRDEVLGTNPNATPGQAEPAADDSAGEEPRAGDEEGDA